MSALRAVITGAGQVSGLGLGNASFFDGLMQGRCALNEITMFDSSRLERSLAAEVQGLDIKNHLSSRQTYLDRSAELAFAAMYFAIDDAGLDMASLDRECAGLLLGSAWGCQDTSELFFSDVLEKGPKFAKPILFPHTYANTVISLIAIEYGLTGFHINYASGAVASAQALVQAYDLVRSGKQHTVFAGGYEALSAVRMAAAVAQGCLSGGSGIKEFCAPFDKGRNGTVLGEGAGVLVVEEYGRARKRGARILAEITGAGLGSGVAKSMDETGLTCDASTCVLSAGNGMQEYDRREASDLAEFFKKSGSNAPVCAIKSLIGETSGAGGALNCIAALHVLNNGHLPCIHNLTEAENKDIDFVTGKGCQADISKVFVNTVAAGGSSACLVFEKPKE